ncbi:hypothetical protein [Planomonospora venezuelensis]|uniref:Chaplin domain-containing protein n=1 Tax=Planomonospora venezuelensis TaxID=1999 RepID=A0A841D5B1_PLAVE|nr:hypothetical protein [Planomonospora venezuelensis]MBB5964143.1 hypothetical protein [Planomonospora venezuelensis]GIN01827.1 hypothetical protein Pve01_34850 [Planomonospora venezuelensis]
MIRRILAGAAIAGFAGLVFAGPAAAGCDRDHGGHGGHGYGGHGGGYVFIDDSNHNEVLNDLLDLAVLGIIEN